MRATQDDAGLTVRFVWNRERRESHQLGQPWRPAERRQAVASAVAAFVVDRIEIAVLYWRSCEQGL